jgi:predicted component of type VI protein secretion system
MNTIKIFMLLVIAVVFTSCSNDDEPKNQAPVLADKTMEVSENLTSDLITTMVATDAEEDELTYSIVSQTPTGSIIINENTGEIYVGNASAFDYEQNTTIVAVIAVFDGINTTQSTLTINILDINEPG